MRCAAPDLHTEETVFRGLAGGRQPDQHTPVLPDVPAGGAVCGRSPEGVKRRAPGRRIGAAALLVSGLALGTAWLVHPASPPLYDGLVLPPEPYRYLQPSRTQALNNLPPTAAHRMLSLGGRSGIVTVATTEQPPQAEIRLYGSALRAEPGTMHVLLTIRAVPPPPLPPGLRLDGNIYAIAVTANGRPVRLRPGHALMVLRATSAFIHPTMEEYIGGRWHRLYASPGYHLTSWGARIAAPGDIGLFVKGGGISSPGANWAPLLAAGLLALGAVAAALVLLRWSRTRTTE